MDAQLNCKWSLLTFYHWSQHLVNPEYVITTVNLPRFSSSKYWFKDPADRHYKSATQGVKVSQTSFIYAMTRIKGCPVCTPWVAQMHVARHTGKGVWSGVKSIWLYSCSATSWLWHLGKSPPSILPPLKWQGRTRWFLRHSSKIKNYNV